jgi:hypothetical protein
MKKGKQTGFIGIIVLIIIALILAKYFLNFNIFTAAASPQGTATVSYTQQVINTVWSYIATPVTFIWNQIAWPILSLAWQSFQSLLVWGKQNASTPIPTHY